METLLEKVETIEQEAKNIIDTASENGKREVDAFIASEEGFLEGVKQRAHERGEQIVAEANAQAKDASSKIRQDGSLSTKAVDSVAANNTEAALGVVKDFFTQDFLA